MSDRQGGCLCGAIRYRVSTEPAMAGNCYCRDCQLATGSAFATIFGVPGDALHIERGTPAEWSVTGVSGGQVTRAFCPTCGTPLFSRSEFTPDLAFIKLTTLDDPDSVQPETNFWTNSAPAWAPIAHDLQSFGTQPADPRDEA